LIAAIADSESAYAVRRVRFAAGCSVRISRRNSVPVISGIL
jgi:hypothetical protein